jgi:hypothetical protein
LPDARVAALDDDGNAKVDDAVPLTLGVAMTGSIEGSADADYFAISVPAGAFVAVLLEVDEGVETPTLSLLDPEGRQLVQGVGVFGCAGPADREIVTRLTRAAPYYVEVSTSIFGRPTSSYSVRVVDLATAASTLIVREGARPTLTSSHVCVLGAFEEAGDVDAVAIGLPPFALLLPVNRLRHGSTGGAMRLTLRASGTVLASTVPRDGFGVGFDGTPMTELLVTGPELQGENDHYLIQPLPLSIYGAGVTYVESEDSTNDAADTPESVTFGPDDGSGYPPWFAGYLPEGDVDHFRFSLAARSRVRVTCRAASLGSAIRALEIRLIEPDGRVVARGVEGGGSYEVNADATLEAGDHLLQVRAGAPDPSIAGALFACTIPDSR